jgi:hypothetical protein
MLHGDWFDSISILVFSDIEKVGSM